VAAIRYIIARYGTPFNLPVGGYEMGGLVTQEEVARVAEHNRPELIVPLTRPERAVSLADRFGLSDMIAERSDRVGRPRGGIHVEKVEVNVETPAGTSSGVYASSMAHRLVPAVSAALVRALGGR
jgi:hypothetical protein